jgi:Ran GTPase-activating protein (RanGAP) involved in mRNA processing and transport
VKELCEVLKSCKNLVYLNLKGNKIGTEGAMAVADFLFNNLSLRECKILILVNLAENEINHDGIIALTSVLNWNNGYLKVLNLDAPVYTSIC